MKKTIIFSQNNLVKYRVAHTHSPSPPTAPTEWLGFATTRPSRKDVVTIDVISSVTSILSRGGGKGRMVNFREWQIFEAENFLKN